jgi:multiple RNA-binding domain-containing protein 1
LLDLYVLLDQIRDIIANIKQISDATLPPSRKAQREQERENAKARQKERAELSPISSLNAGTKRKRSDVDDADPKLKEFLEVMQPASKPKTWVTQGEDDSALEPPTKMQAIEVPEAESDGEYEAVPKKSRKTSPPKATIQTEPVAVSSMMERPTEDDEAVVAPAAPDATDDDWLRSRTNRLLDLVDLEDLVVHSRVEASVSANANDVAETTTVEPVTNEEPSIEEEEFEGFEDEKPDPVIEAIKSNGRLFVRNLPYTASEEDLREHFETYGTLDEVFLYFFVLFSSVS